MIKNPKKQKMHAFLRSQFSFTPYGTSIRNLPDIFNYIYANKNKGTVYSGAQAYIVRLTKKTVHQPIYCRLANEVYNYINNGKTETQVSFDNWHKQTCEMFIFDCSKYGINAHYGMAQKFTNLALKYLYCFDDSQSVHPTKFQYCHMALDGYTYYSPLKRYQSHKMYSGYIIYFPFYQRQVAPTSVFRRTPWSKIATWDDYITIQNEIREYLTAKPMTYADVSHLDSSHLAKVSHTYRLTPFETEFFVWK